MNTITKADFDDICKKDKYFAKRWNYFKVVIEQAKLINPTSVLEVGANGFPMYPESTTLDINKKVNPTVVQDATITPWPFKDAQFDLFICLQTWEHLNGKQVDAFREVRRTCKKAIMSFPYKWDWTDPKDIHYNLEETHFSVWTENLPHRKILVEGRMIYIFDSL